MANEEGKITEISAAKFVENSIIAYGREVLEERAIPVDLDGLKPSQRRTVYSLFKLGSKPNGNFMKCAKVVGDTMGNYHPHGDVSLYETLVKMVNSRYPLIEGHGNFGSATGDLPAAARYTEARITKLGMDMMVDLQVMPTAPNYSNEIQEPVVLPACVPFLLCNGSQGIAVGVACNIPPHNLGEIVDATIRLVKKPSTKISRLMKYISGPDYTNGGILTSSAQEIYEVYKNGKGRLNFQCDYNIEDAKDHKILLVTSLAPNFDVDRFITKCKALSDDGAIEYVNDGTDYKKGMRLEVGFKNPQPINDIVLPMLNTAVNYEFYAQEQRWVVDGAKDGGEKKFNHYNLKTLLESFITQRRHIEKLLLLAEQRKVNDEIELAEARLIATQKLDAVVKILRDKKNTGREMIVQRLMKEIKYTERQANYICDLKLIQVANFSADEQRDNIKRLQARLKEIAAALKDLNGVLIRRLKEVKKRYGDERRTVVSGGGKKPSKLRMKVQQKYVMVAPDGGYRSFDDVPTKRGDWPKRKSSMPESAHITKGGEMATVVFQGGAAQEVPVGYTKDGFLNYEKDEQHGEIVGVVSEKSPLLMVISENAEICTIENPQGIGNYQLGKFSTPVKAVLGLNPKEKDRFLLISKSGSAYWDWAESLDVKRKNVKGKHLGGLKTLVHAVAVKQDQHFYDQDGNKFEPFKFGGAGETFDVKVPKKLHVVCVGQNLVLDKEGVPSILDKQEAVVAIRNKEVSRVYPLE